MAVNLGAAYVALKGDMGPLKLDLRTAKRLVSRSVTSIAKIAGRGITGAIKGIGGVITSIGRSLFSLKGIAVVALAGWGIKRLISNWIELANVQEAAEKRLASVLKSTGEAAGFNIEQLKEMAIAMQEVTTSGDEVILTGMAMLSTFKQIRGEAFERTMMSALDLSEVMQQDLRSSIVMLGKALNDPVANLGALSRAGIQFTVTQRDVIKELWRSGKQIEAQNILLKELESQFGGAAKAATEIFGGAVKQLGNTWGDLKEQLGFVITKNDIITKGIKYLHEIVKGIIPLIKEKLVPIFDELASKLYIWFLMNKDIIKQKLAELFSRIATAVKKVWEWIKELAASGKLQEWAKTAKESLELVWNFAKKVVAVFLGIGETIGNVVGSAVRAWKTLKSLFSTDLEANIKFRGILSPAKPLSEAVQDATWMLTDLTDMVNESKPEANFDFVGTVDGATLPLSQAVAKTGGKFDELNEWWWKSIAPIKETITIDIDVSPAKNALNALNRYYTTAISSMMRDLAMTFGTGYYAEEFRRLTTERIRDLEGRWERGRDVIGSFQTGTGPGGLPHTGVFFGHKGEIVKSPQESDTERRGSGGANINITIAPTFMTGDRAAGRNAAIELKRELDNLGVRWGTV